MILAFNDTDTRYAVEWTDDAGVAIVPDAIEFVATAVGASAATIIWDLDDDEITYADEVISVHIDDAYELPEGRYFYTLRARATGSDWTLLDSGLLRSRWV